MQQISLEALLPVAFDPTTCKLHCAVFNGDEHPIDVLANDPVGWQGWNSWRAGKDDFNRQFIFSLAQDRHDATLWLFGGIWEVIGRHARSYDVVHRDDLMGPFVRRLYVNATSSCCRSEPLNEQELQQVSLVRTPELGIRIIGAAIGDGDLWVRCRREQNLGDRAGGSVAN